MTISAHPLVIRARELADSLLTPAAERVDQEGVPVSHIEAVRGSGLLGLNAPVAYGGSAAPAAVARETAEILAGACCSTWFVQTQHHTPVLTLAQAELPVRERLLGPLARGELLSGVAYAHLRSYPRVPVRARREGGAWRFHGTVPWYTGWGLNDVLLLAGVTEDDEALFAFVEARVQPGLRPSEPMRLAALTASRTVSLDLDGLRVPEDAVALRMPYRDWAA
ncbi:acyl-CoA dehydrogenase family protein, partial [Streptomyces sp. NPDC048279]|uniref:acyl-CoA dehydrogenase family protein n=1 Tax=Streptomyces sp. NPDC048279 TaxID=3154714 RepID=UPI0034347446